MVLRNVVLASKRFVLSDQKVGSEQNPTQTHQETVTALATKV